MSRQERAPDFLSVHLRRRICAKCVSSRNLMQDLRLCRVGISDSVRRASPTQMSQNNRRAGAPSATFFLHLHKLCCQLCCQLSCTDYMFIIQFYSSYICHLKNNNRQNVTPALKIDFDTDLTPNITRHSCTISAELVVSSFINNLVRLSSIVPFHIIYQVNLY